MSTEQARAIAAYGEDQLRIPPQSMEAEQSVLGAALQEPASLTLVMEALAPDDFYYPQHAMLFSAMQSLFSQARAVDLVTMDAELKRTGSISGVGGTEYLIELIRFVPTTAHLKHYLDIVLEKSTLRKLITASSEIAQVC